MATFTVQVTANARRNEIAGWLGEKLKVRISAPAVEGKANAELVRFVAECLDVRASAIEIIRGGTAKTKLLHVEGIDDEALRSRIGVRITLHK
jgi:hypothetical protein